MLKEPDRIQCELLYTVYVGRLDIEGWLDTSLTGVFCFIFCLIATLVRTCSSHLFPHTLYAQLSSLVTTTFFF